MLWIGKCGVYDCIKLLICGYSSIKKADNNYYKWIKANNCIKLLKCECGGIKEDDTNYYKWIKVNNIDYWNYIQIKYIWI